MIERREREILLRRRWRQQLERGRIDRRELLTRSLMAGLGMAGAGVAARLGVGSAFAARPLTPTFYQWIEDLHPGIPDVNAKFPGINYQIAPVEGFGIERFVAEAKSGESTWDVYVGMTPFVEMTAMIEADVIEPWDNYIPKEVIDDLIVWGTPERIRDRVEDYAANGVTTTAPSIMGRGEPVRDTIRALAPSA